MCPERRHNLLTSPLLGWSGIPSQFGLPPDTGMYPHVWVKYTPVWVITTMQKSKYEIKANDVNGTLPAECGESVASGMPPIGQVGTGRHQTTDPGAGGSQATPAATAELSTGPNSMLVTNHPSSNPTRTEKPSISPGVGATILDHENHSNPIETASPETWQTVKRRKNRHNDRNLRELKKLEAYDQLFRSKENHYNKYFNIRFPGCNIMEDISTIKLNNEITKELKGAKIRKSGRSALFIEIANKEQSEKIQKLKELANHPIIVQQHKNYNQTKGVIRSKCLKLDTEKEIAEHLKSQDVADVKESQSNEITKSFKQTPTS